MRALSNLLENAGRYTPPGIRWTHRSKCRIELSAKNFGPGLSEGTQTRVLERFYRAETSRGRAGGGSGLELAIVCTLVELHGGRVEAHNRPEGDAAFHVTLPQGTQETQMLGMSG